MTGVAVGAIAATIIKNNKEAIAASLEKVASMVKGLADDETADAADDIDVQETTESDNSEKE